MSDARNKMKNVPNQLTVFRVILIIPFVVMMLGCNAEWPWLLQIFGTKAVLEYASLALFIIASLTDLLDGKIARKYNVVSNFGKFMDPLADKLLVCAAMILLVEMGRIPSFIVVIIISREFIISGFRLIAADNGVVIAASYWGKFKTTFQMIMIGMMIVLDAPFLTDASLVAAYGVLANIIMWIALALTIISLVDYLVKNRDIMKEGTK